MLDPDPKQLFRPPCPRRPTTYRHHLRPPTTLRHRPPTTSRSRPPTTTRPRRSTAPCPRPPTPKKSKNNQS